MYSQRAIDVGLGRRKADKAFTGGKLVNVFTAEVYEAGVAIAGDRLLIRTQSKLYSIRED